MTKDEMKDRISMALKDPILQQGFEIICKNIAELEKENKQLNVKLDEAKEIIKTGLEGIKREFIVAGNERPYREEAIRLCNEYCEKAEVFLKEVSE